ncbi:MAG: acyltransferase family protein, partial [Leptothrix sp. (in: b-proteobacteria)]
LSNALLLHDVAGFPALSAGLWYVGIDLQLFALTALLVALLRATGLQGVRLATLAVALVAGGVALSLLWVNRLPGADLWAPYFFGSYGLGVLAHWLGQPGAEPRRASRWVRGLGGVALLLLVALALWLEWRSRIALAGVLALALALNLGRARLPQTWGHGRIRHLARISYGVFLVHYPVSLLVASLLTWAAPESALANLLGLVIAWLLSLWAGDALLRGVAGWQALRRELGQAASIGEPRQFGLVRRVDLLGWPASGRRVLP